MRAGARFGHLLLFVAALCAGVRAMRAVTPPPTEMGLGAKLAYYAAHADELDAVYIGSSRVFRSFVPAEIDARLAERGIALASFNLGVPGMGDFEATWLLGEVLERASPRLAWVVLEPPRFDPTMYAANAASARELGWHTTRETLAALDAVLAGEPGPARRGLLRGHLELWARRLLNLGQGRRVVARVLDGDPDPAAHGLTAGVLARDRGYRALEDERDPDVARRRADFLADQAAYLEQVGRIAAGRALRPSLAGYPLALLEAQIARVRAAGAEPVYVLPPAGQARAVALALAEAGHLPCLIDLASPVEHPELYRPEHRFDRNHLDRDAALEFSRLFAARFAGVIAAREDE